MRMLKGPNKKFEIAGIPDSRCRLYLNLPGKGKINFNFYRTFLWSLKRFEGPHRNVKIKIQVNFYFETTYWNARGGKGCRCRTQNLLLTIRIRMFLQKQPFVNVLQKGVLKTSRKIYFKNPVRVCFLIKLHAQR